MKRKFLKLGFLLIAAIFFAGLGYGLFFLYTFDRFEKKITITLGSDSSSVFDTLKSLASNRPPKLKGMGEERINILLLGIAGKGKPGQNLTDTIMIASINVKTNQVALISIPRDFYVKVPDLDIQTKINSVYQIGVSNLGSEKEGAELVEKTVSDITGLNIHYYVIMNFNGFEKVIDSVGGINIMNERDIFDPRYPGPNYSYETFKLDKGFHILDGATTLKYVRERHDDPEGDFGRAKRQQQVMQATKNKAFSLGSMLNAFKMKDLMKSLGDNIKINVSPEEIGDFLDLSKKLDTNNISSVVVDAWNRDSLLKVSHVFYGDTRAFVLIPRVGNYSEIQEMAQNVFDLNKIKRKKEEIAKEEAKIAIINKSGDIALQGKIRKLLENNFGYKNVYALTDSQKNLEEKTIAFDITNGAKPFTLDEIVTKLPASASYSLEDNYKNIIENTSPDIVIVLGKDIISKYNMEEDSIEDYKNATDTNEYTEFINR